MELHYRVLEWAQPCNPAPARAAAMGVSLGFKTQGNKPVSNKLNIIILEYTTASIIACCYVIKSHQSNMLNQCLLNLESIKLGSVY